MSDPTIPDRPRRPAPMPATVLQASRLSPTMVRVVFGGDGLARFRPSVFSDSYVKLTFPCPGVRYPEPLDLGQIHAGFPQSQWPVVRTYTVRDWDAERCALTIDFVVHGDSGIAGPWAAAAQPGDRIFLQGPGGAYSPDQRAGWHLLVGDESALPAIAVAIDRLAPDASGQVLIEVPGPASEIPLETPTRRCAHLGAQERPVRRATGGSRSLRWRSRMLRYTPSCTARPASSPSSGGCSGWT